MREIKTSVKSIEETISVCLNNNLAFAAYRLPNRTGKALVVQEKQETEELTNLSKVTALKGFLVAPFLRSVENRIFIIQPDFYCTGEVPVEKFKKLVKIKNPLHPSKIRPLPFEVSKNEYLGQIKEITNAIKSKRIQKAVLSRIKLVNSNCNSMLPEVFSKLCDAFPKAFVYVFKADGHFWMGATPEPFAFLEKNVFQTSSVAGTKENNEKFLQIENWGNKEKLEQQFVSDHIDKVLQTNNWDNIVQHGPYVEKAGNLMHLRTDFTTTASVVNGNVGELLSRLHPTPAVCGSPTKEALEIICSVEKYDREYYGGFLGPVGMENPMMLFVNLRCMQIVGSQLILYSGGGITIDSNPVDEWYETEIKAGTLLSVIKNMT